MIKQPEKMKYRIFLICTILKVVYVFLLSIWHYLELFKCFFYLLSNIPIFPCAAGSEGGMYKAENESF